MRVRVATLLALFLFSLTAAAEIYRDRRAGISYDVPEWWDSEEREQGMVMATEDQSLVVMVWTPRGQTIEDAIDGLEEELEKVMQNPRPDGKPTTGSLNGMETVSISGRGRIDGTRAEYSVTVLGAKRPVIIMAFGETGKYEKHTEELKGFLKTIKRIK